jgi:hypothetical protein
VHQTIVSMHAAMQHDMMQHDTTSPAVLAAERPASGAGTHGA